MTESRARKTAGLVLAAGVLCLAFAYVALKYLPVPFAWLFAVVVLGSTAAMVYVANSNWKAVFLNTLVVFLLLAAIEVYFHFDRKPITRDTLETLSGEPLDLDQPHAVLGYGPAPGAEGTWTRYIGDDFVYQMSLSIDANGFRTMPNDEDIALPCIFFFGGSYTFGSGVNDNETAAYRVAQSTAGQYRVFNLAYRGYGPHQMLAALEDDSHAGVLGCRASVAIYQMIPNHIDRAAGLVSWDENGPKYVLNGAGDAVRQGTFAKPSQAAKNLLEKIADRSTIYSRLRRFLADKATEDSAALTHAILRRANDIVTTGVSGGQFHVIYWPAATPLTTTVIEGLENDGIAVHPIAQILPNLRTASHQYRLHKYDGHPNQLAHQLISEYVVDQILSAN